MRILAALMLVSCAYLQAARGEGEMPKQETLSDIFARKIAYTRASPFYKELHTPHTRRFLPKPWKPGTGEFSIGAGWGIRAEGMDAPPGPFAVEELRAFFRDAGDIGLKSGPASKEIVLRVAGKASDRISADSYSLKASKRCIEITSPTPRGVLYGVYYLEQLLLDRGIPALKPMSVRRKPLFDVRMFGDMYGTFTVSGLRIDRPVSRETFSAMSRFGANATFSFVELSDYLGPAAYPELANPEREKNLAQLKRLADMAHSVGVDLYLDAYNPKLPESHLVFAAHPNARGSTQWRAGIRCLCPSDPETLEYIAESYADIFRRIPSLGGIVAIIGGEGFYHCYMRRVSDPPDCPRCSKRSAEEVVADLTNAVFRAVRKVKPDAELFAWPYSAFIWSKEPYQLDLISRLDPGIHLVSEIDKDHQYQKDGYVKNIWDYSIDFLGPSDRYKAQADVVRSRGMKQACKTETAVSLEMHSVPYIPCMQRWSERMEVIRAQKPTSIYYAYDITGFARSRPEELAGRLSWAPSDGPDEEIRKIAVRDFGPEVAFDVIEAWKLFSEAVGHIPYLTHGYYQGPSFIGPGQPLMLSEDDLPPEFFGRHFYLAENDLSEGSAEALALRPIYAADVRVSHAEMADMDRAVDLWEKGVGILRQARSKVSTPYRKEFQRELDMGAYLLAVFRSVSYCNHFFELRAQYRDLTKDAPTTAANRDRALELLDQMASIVDADLSNARRALIIARRDPRLDLAVRLDLDYPPLTKIIEAKIGYAEVLLRELLPAEKEKIRKT